MLRTLFRFCRGLFAASPAIPDTRLGCASEAGWYRSWARMEAALSLCDGRRSGEFVYRVLGMLVCIEAMTLDQAKELLAGSIGAHQADLAANRATCLDCRRIDAMRFELRRRRRTLRVVRPLHASDN